VDPADIEDAAVLLSYTLGARALEGLPIKDEEVSNWHSQLSHRVEVLSTPY
jgi:hypothetical protein